MTLHLAESAYKVMVAHCYDGMPLEACGLLVGDAETGRVRRAVAARNDAVSARVYTVNPLDHLHADRAAEADGMDVIGVFHSHTHTDAYPSATDVAQAPDPAWHYVLVSLRDEAPTVRSYRIVGGNISEEPIVLEGR